MCGITGILDTSHSGFLEKDVKTLFGMMLLNSFRGNSSTGVFGIDKKDRSNILKVMGHPYEWNSYQVSDLFWNKMKSDFRYVVAHGRLPTKGKTTIENAHPFQIGDITLVHNGTLINWEDTQKKHGQTFEVDSQFITYLIDKVGIDETLKTINGAWALVYFDAKDASLNFIRNGQRPLCFAINTWKDRMYFGSEEHYVKWGMSHGSAHSEMKVTDFTTNTLYKVTTKFNKLEIETQDKSSYYPGKSSHYYSGSHNRHYYHGFGGYVGFDDDECEYVPPTTIKQDSVIPFTKKEGSNYSPVNSPLLNKITMCVEEDLIFPFSYCHEGAEGSGIQVIYGYHEQDSNIQIVVPTKGHAINYTSLPKGTKLIGRIKAIHPLDPMTGSDKYHTRVALDNVTIYKETNEQNHSVQSM